MVLFWEVPRGEILCLSRARYLREWHASASGMMFFDVNMKSLTFPRHVQAPLHLVYCGSWCVTQVYTAYLTSAVIFKRERERERKRQRGHKECRFSYFRIFSFLCYHLDGKTDLLRWEEFREACAGIVRHLEPTFLQSQVAKSRPKIWLVLTLHLRLLQAGCSKTTSQFWAFDVPGVHSNIYCQIPWSFRRFPSGAFREKRDLDATSVCELGFTHWCMLKRSKEEKIESRKILKDTEISSHDPMAARNL